MGIIPLDAKAVTVIVLACVIPLLPLVGTEIPLQGPFKLWIHEQRFADAVEGGTLLTNSIRFDPPGGLLGFLVTRKQVMAHLEDWVGKGHALLLKTLSEGAR